jgi:outer membrane protein assembly factor BamA
MPYWDPDRGFRLDAGYEHGFQIFGDGDSYDRVNGQVGMVQRLSSAPGWLSETKLAGRLAGGYGWDNNGQHFRFGGPGRFRGVQADGVEGNAFWLSTLEWRFPLSGEIDYQVIDNTAALHSIDGALFYDVGRSYLFDRPQGDIDHAVGGGLYFEIPLLSFVENLTVRTEYGYSLVNHTSAVWFGLYRAF